MAVTATQNIGPTLVETLTGNTTSASDTNRRVTHDNFIDTVTLNAASTPPATLMACFVATLSSGTLTLDLTALTGTNGATVDGTGLRVQLLKVKNLGANALNITAGASNGYDAFDADFEITIPSGGMVLIFGNDAGSDISSSYKTLDLAGTGAQTSEWTVVMG